MQFGLLPKPELIEDDSPDVDSVSGESRVGSCERWVDLVNWRKLFPCSGRVFLAENIIVGVEKEYRAGLESEVVGSISFVDGLVEDLMIYFESLSRELYNTPVDVTNSPILKIVKKGGLLLAVPDEECQGDPRVNDIIKIHGAPSRILRSMRELDNCKKTSIVIEEMSLLDLELLGVAIVDVMEFRDGEKSFLNFDAR